MDESWYLIKSQLYTCWFIPSNTHVYTGFMENGNGYRQEPLSEYMKMIPNTIGENGP